MKRINLLGRMFLGLMFASASLVALACSDGGTPDEGTGSEDDTGTGDSDTDTGTESDSETDTGTGSDATPTASAGQPCWNDYFDSWHPNAEEPDCAQGFDCIGNSDESWCTKHCDDMVDTGDYNEDDDGLIGWCCGDMIDPCDPNRYWLPESMNFYCIPRTVPLAQECDLDLVWNGDNASCAPVCDGTDLVYNTSCAQYQDAYGDATFCTFPCDPGNEDVDCLLEPAFADGCCGEIMGGNFCLIAELCP